MERIASVETAEGKTIDFEEVLKGKKVVGLYFSASWCPPCQAFSPELREFAVNHSNDFVVVLVSHDHDKEAFASYGKKYPEFYRIPWEQRELRAGLSAAYSIIGLPTLQIVDAKTKKSISSWGRFAIQSNPKGAMRSWLNNKSGVGFVDNAHVFLIVAGVIFALLAAFHFYGDRVRLLLLNNK